MPKKLTQITASKRPPIRRIIRRRKVNNKDSEIENSENVEQAWRFPPWLGELQWKVKNWCDEQFPPEPELFKCPFYYYWNEYARSDFYPQKKHFESKCFQCYEEVSRTNMIVCTYPGCQKVYHEKCCGHVILRLDNLGNYIYNCRRHNCEDCNNENVVFQCSTCQNAYCCLCITQHLGCTRVGEESYCHNCVEQACLIGAANILVDMRNRLF